MVAKLKTLPEFLTFFKDERTCQEYFRQIRFRSNAFCVHCGHSHVNEFTDGKRFRCAKCKKDFTIITGTVFGESKIPLKKWFVAIYLLSKSKDGISSIDFSKGVGVTQKTISLMDKRIRTAVGNKKLPVSSRVLATSA